MASSSSMEDVASASLKGLAMGIETPVDVQRLLATRVAHLEAENRALKKEVASATAAADDLFGGGGPSTGEEQQPQKPAATGPRTLIRAASRSWRVGGGLDQLSTATGTPAGPQTTHAAPTAAALLSRRGSFVAPSAWKKPLKVTVSGASGQIANHLLFKIAAGEVFGKDQPIHLALLGSSNLDTLEGVAMELEDSLFPLLREVRLGLDPQDMFAGCHWALLIGAKPRGPGMERSALLDLNGQIFAEQGKALNAVADQNCRVLVVGNPANTNALICMENAPRIPRRNFHALMRLDENRAKCQLAIKSGFFYSAVSSVCIWGNHSATQVPDFLNARIEGKPASSAIERAWLETEFTQCVQQRGAQLIKKWGRSSAASTAVSIADHLASLYVPTKPNDFFTTAVCSDGNSYGIQPGLIFGFPARSRGDGDYEIVKGLVWDDLIEARIKSSESELAKEKECVHHLIGIDGGVCQLAKRDTTLPGDFDRSAAPA